MVAMKAASLEFQKAVMLECLLVDLMAHLMELQTVEDLVLQMVVDSARKLE